MLVDKFGRKINYLRLAVTDKCNLRCQYCMPAEGIKYQEKDSLLNYEEMVKLVTVLAEMGVNKVRLTGGEPFVRKDFIYLLENLNKIESLDEINITTNGTLIYRYYEQLKELKIGSINLSIDSLDKENFFKITRRNAFDRVWKTFEELQKHGFKTKLNIVCLPNQNTHELKDFVALTKDRDISVRFIEEMPFNGTGLREVKTVWNKDKIFYEISDHFKDIEKLPSAKSSTSENYRVKGHKGTFGIIPAFTRTICGGCNRIRITATGDLKLCLFDDGVFNLRDQIRKGASKEQLKTLFTNLIQQKPENGFIAENARKNSDKVSESMSTIGG
ncbi:MAG: molybdenum cofactor biosynthesis protein A [Planctomycetota bacterium]|jgi:molybdenum cofactor biosynthesis protein A